MPQNKGKLILIGLVCILMGITAGAAASWYFTTNILSTSFAYAEVQETIAGSEQKLATLEYLGHGHAKKARESLEYVLDSDILDLGHNAWTKKDKSILAALKQIRHYRSEHPWHSPIPGMDQQVAKVLRTGEKR